MKIPSSSIETLSIFFGAVLGKKKVLKSNRGQLSIFLGITLILVMSMLAFIINVGLFVKAKINLQNAVDAAAYSGAATQARQLTNIAYANWELRNTFKEWMYKYYVLGQKGLFNPTNAPFANLNGKNPSMDFRLQVPPGLLFNAGTATNSVPNDAYNVPSICIHNNTSKDICPLYMIPGLPRFQAIGVAGITEIHEAIVDKLVKEKGADCSDRSVINYLATMTWTYGSGIKEIPGAPLIAANRPGAWPQAIELAMRIRNLEMIVNRPPVSEGMGINEANQLTTVAPEISLNERPYKAFMSAYRNLSGGKYKDAGSDELVNNFKLYELPPKPFDARSAPVSSFLIPDGVGYAGTSGSPLNKSYLDLQIVPVNYALMYSTFTTTSYKYDGVDAESSCGVSKTAIPVPGYILGFVKNPEVITYYAVKGESKFIGLFFPFSKTSGIPLTAYAAAKPFGGRIGPKLFEFSEAGLNLVARNDKDKKSKPYISGLKPPGAIGVFKTGFPIPYDNSFWVSNNGSITLGGVPGANQRPAYGIPNMIYDFEDENDLIAQSSSIDAVQDILFNSPPGPPTETLGLYNRVQFKKLVESNTFKFTSGAVISSEKITEAFIRARRPTKYDAINYLVPDYKTLEGIPNGTLPFISQIYGQTTPNSIRYRLFAPLSGASLLYKNNNDVEQVVSKYILASERAVDTYLVSLLGVANAIYSTPTSGGNANNYADAAKTIHINAGTGGGAKPPLLVDANCAKDVASKFNHFFSPNAATACGIVPISKLMVDYIGKHSDPSNGSDLYYIADYAIPGSDPRDLLKNSLQLMTAYYPGKRQGVQQDVNATTNHPLGLDAADAKAYSSRRNFYSTKFVQLAKLMDSPVNAQGSTFGISDYATNPALKEGATGFPNDLIGKVNIRNPIEATLSGLNKSYYSDF